MDGSSRDPFNFGLPRITMEPCPAPGLLNAQLETVLVRSSRSGCETGSWKENDKQRDSVAEAVHAGAEAVCLRVWAVRHRFSQTRAGEFGSNLI